MRTRWRMVAVLAAGLTLGAVPGLWAAGEEKLAEQLTRLMQTGRKIVSDNQALINDPSKGDKGFTPQVFGDQVIAEYAKSTGIDLRHPAGEDGRWLALMLEAQKDTVAEAQSIINTPGMGFKGFIPAAFVRKAGEKFTAKSGLTMKFTATEYRNARNEPDGFEKKVFVLFGGSTYPKGKAYSELVEVGGKKMYRIMFPEYAAKSCLSCHGEPRGERDITGGRKEGQKEGDLAGALSWTIPLR
jgi:Protein of unknown function (DUF3365)